MEEYLFEFQGIVRRLPVYAVASGVKIAYLDSFCDLELVNALSAQMAEAIERGERYAAAERVVILTAVSKGVPFAYTVANLLSKNGKKVLLAIARKQRKRFFGKVVTVGKTSITSEAGGDELVLAENDAKKLNGAPVILLDDMYSTGASVEALSALAEKCGADVIEKIVAVWETADPSVPPPVKYVAVLPLLLG